jgi:hypothetical protein
MRIKNMRLTKAQIDTIRKATSQNFGEDALIRLFGSRLDDTKRGGDVDRCSSLQTKLSARPMDLVDLQSAGGLLLQEVRTRGRARCPGKLKCA